MDGHGLPNPDGEGFTFDVDVPRTVGLPERFVAVLLDWGMLVVLSWALAFGLITVGFAPEAGATPAGGDALVLLWLTVILELPVSLAYFTVLEGSYGRTVGKAAADLRVVSMDGSPVGYFDAFVRTLLRFLWVTPVLGQVFLLVDAVLVKRSEMEQRIGDVAADTVVARDGPPS